MIEACGPDPKLLALLNASGALSIRKQAGPLDEDDFDRRVLALATLLANALRPADNAKVLELTRLLNRDWATLSDTERAAALRGAAAALRRFPDRVGERMLNRAERAAQNIEQRTRVAARREFGLDIPRQLPAALQSEARRLAEPLPEFVAEEFDRRSNFFLIAASALVAGLVLRGKTSAEITQRVVDTATSFVRRPAYPLALSATVLNRARTAALLNAYDEAGVAIYEIEAVLDGRTCTKCRYMHGKRFRVDGGVDLVRGVSRTASPQRIERVNPFLSEGVDREGRRIVFVQSERGGRRVLARQIEVGGEGERGRFGSEASERTLTSLGIGPPPFHPYCRCIPKPV